MNLSFYSLTYRNYSLENDNLKVVISSLGATITNIIVKSKNLDVVLGLKDPGDYLDDIGDYFGGTIGRVCNRISKSKFDLNGKTYYLDNNNSGNTLHGGNHPWNKNRFDLEEQTDNSLLFKLDSADGDQHFPGHLVLYVKYTLNDHSLRVEYKATTDKDTPVNITNHTYFNLNGHKAGSILNHYINVNSDEITEIDEKLIPTGLILSTINTPLELNGTFGDHINEDYYQLNYSAGFDFNYILKSEDALTMKGDISNITLKIKTDYPGIQIYTGNFLNRVQGKEDFVYHRHYGVALEPQLFPDAVNHPNFPSTILHPGETYQHYFEYIFSEE